MKTETKAAAKKAVREVKNLRTTNTQKGFGYCCRCCRCCRCW